jgi:4-alpha-glucanotransferase
VVASPETLQALLDALGAEAPPEPVFVIWDRKPIRLLRGELQLETGETIDLKSGTLRGCPFGYHTLRVHERESLVISAPSKSYSDPSMNRSWGVFAPMYALQSVTPGFGEWQHLVDWLHQSGAKVVATLPLLASFVDEPSPYSPASRLFWNEFYLDVKLPTSRSELVNYGKIMGAKRPALECEALAFFRNGAPKAFNEYRDIKRNLDDYAAFRATGEKLGRPWQSWPERMRNGDLRPGDYDERTKNYYAYIQWHAQQKMDALLRNCASKDIRFYLDLPLGVYPDGYDVWRERESFALEASAGAPPDAFFTKGQDWGFSPLNPHRLRQTRYRHLIDVLRFQMRHTGLLRIDHVMWLHRLYWIPKGYPPSHGAYVQYPAEELYGILSLESHRHKTVIVGENLGTVPPEVNACMRRHHLRETYVLQYELASQKPRRPPRRSVASLNTHDMPTFEAFLRGLDIDDRFNLGLISKSNLPRQHRSRKTLVAGLQLEDALQRLAKSDAEVVLINIEDLWRETLPQNVPGTSTERPNWRRRLRYSLDEIKSDPAVRRLLKLVADARALSRPTGSRDRVRRKRASAPAPH